MNKTAISQNEINAEGGDGTQQGGIKIFTVAFHTSP